MGNEMEIPFLNGLFNSKSIMVKLFLSIFMRNIVTTLAQNAPKRMGYYWKETHLFKYF